MHANPLACEIMSEQLGTQTTFLRFGTPAVLIRAVMMLFMKSSPVLSRPMTPRTRLGTNLRRTGMVTVLQARAVRKVIV